MATETPTGPNGPLNLPTVGRQARVVVCGHFQHGSWLKAGVQRHRTLSN